MSDEAQALTPFRSNAEMTAAIQDPRYAKDEAYRQDVADRMTMTGGTQQSSTPAAPFRSGAEMTAAIQDPRYAKDEAYRQDVADRIAAGSAAPTPHNATPQTATAPAASPFYEVTGGRAQFLEARHRITQQASAADRQRWNDAIDDGDTATIRGLIAAYQAPAAPAPSRPTTGGFGSQAEMFAAMRDPRYAKSEAYRQTVMDRMAKGVETQQSSTPAVPFQSDAEMVKAIQDPRYRKDEAYRQAVAARIAGKA